MAHFAQIDENNLVIQVIVVHNNETHLPDGTESEQKGIDFCKTLFGTHTNWVQTSYNRTFRKNYGGIGYTYDPTRDAFIPAQPFASWVLNEDTCQWEAPIPYPTDNKLYTWDEATTSWIVSPQIAGE